MPVREILLLGDDRLRREAVPVADVTAAEIRGAISDLGETLADFRLRNGFGRGIAAPQIGIDRRLLFVDMRDGSFGPAPLVNPRIVRASEETMELWDDCFSFPDLLVRVRRHLEVEVAYLDADGRSQLVTARGDLSELLQHEIDHLDGILAVDRAIDGPHAGIRRR